MKYFPPELYLALQEDGDEAMDAADAAWDEAVEAYSRRVDAIRSQLPKPVRDLLFDKYYLHDAEIFHVGQEGESFVIILGPEWPPRDTLILTYTLDAPPSIITDALPEPHRSKHCQWMHDEIDLAPEGDGFTHAIALSNGLEIGLRFRSLDLHSIPNLLVDERALARPA